MATIINNPNPTEVVTGGDGMGVGLIVGILLAIVVIGLFVMYGFPALRGQDTQSNNPSVKIELPVTPTPNPTPKPSY